MNFHCFLSHQVLVTSKIDLNPENHELILVHNYGINYQILKHKKLTNVQYSSVCFITTYYCCI